MPKSLVAIFVISTMIVFFLAGCSYHPNVEITRDYIYNSYWSKDSWNGAAVSIWRVLPNDRIKSKNIHSLDGFEIHNNIIKDSSFRYISYSRGYDLNKIFFNKKNENTIWYVKGNTSDMVDYIGSLQKDTWYRFDTYIYKKWVYYVYVDLKGKVHTWAVNPVNI